MSSWEVDLDFGDRFTDIGRLTFESIKSIGITAGTLYNDMEKYLRDLNMPAVLLYYHKLYLQHMGFEKLVTAPDLGHDGIITSKKNKKIWVNKDITIKDKLLFCSFIITFFLKFPKCPSLDLSKRALMCFYRQNYDFKMLMTLLIIHPAMLRFSIQYKLIMYYIQILLECNISPMFIYNVGGCYANAKILYSYEYKTLIKCLLALVKQRHSLDSRIEKEIEKAQ